MARSFSSYNKVTYKISVTIRQIQRYLQWAREKNSYAQKQLPDQLPFRVYKHQSVLIRKLGDADLQLQYNKVTNIELAIKNLNGIIIEPGETFSFCYLVGATTAKKGYLVGMQLSDGEAIAGIGGGICQIANLIHWLCLHSPLTVTERHHHSFDPFPDSGRVVPFGCGASIFYNYRDYRFKNNTPHRFQLLFWLDKKCLNGDLRIDQELPYTYHIFEQNHAFIKKDDQFYRRNEIWRKQIAKEGGHQLSIECLQKNMALVKYIPDQYICEDSE